MAQLQRRRNLIWLLSVAIAALGGCIAVFAKLGWFKTTLTTVGVALVMTIWLGTVLVWDDK